MTNNTIPETPSEGDRFHHKRDGVLWIKSDGEARYLTMWECFKFMFGWRP